jgi:hypothetical protein
MYIGCVSYAAAAVSAKEEEEENVSRRNSPKDGDKGKGY